MSDIKEKFLLARIRLFNDENAFAEVFHGHRDSLLRFLRQRLPTAPDADDAFNTTALRTWNYLRSAQVESVAGLIFTIARGVVAEHYRQNKASTISLEQAEAIPASISDQGQESHRIETRAELLLIRRQLQAMDELEANYLRWRYLEDKSIREIAALTQKSEAAVRTGLHRALKKLKESIQENSSQL